MNVFILVNPWTIQQPCDVTRHKWSRAVRTHTHVRLNHACFTPAGLLPRRDVCQGSGCVGLAQTCPSLLIVPQRKDPQSVLKIKHMHALRCKLFLYCNGQIPRNKSTFEFLLHSCRWSLQISFLVHFKLFLCLGRVCV